MIQDTKGSTCSTNAESTIVNCDGCLYYNKISFSLSPAYNDRGETKCCHYAIFTGKLRRNDKQERVSALECYKHSGTPYTVSTKLKRALLKKECSNARRDSFLYQSYDNNEQYSNNVNSKILEDLPVSIISKKMYKKEYL